MVSAEFRIDRDPHGIQADQPLTDADRGKIEQELRKSATRNLTRRELDDHPPCPSYSTQPHHTESQNCRSEDALHQRA